MRGLAFVAVVVAAVAHAAAAGMGVCYDIYDANNIDKHFRTIKTRFSAVRTYQTSLWTPRNVIDAGADNGLAVYAGIWLRDGMDFNKELQAVIDGHYRHPGTLQAVFVGNEDLMNNWNQWAIRDKVNAARSRLRSAGINVPVGSVQTDGDWLKNRDLANACDIMGVNIYAFFGGSPVSWTNPIADLDARWKAMTQAFGGNKVMLTETGWPHGGGNNGNHVSNRGNAIDYFTKVQAWVNAGNGGAAPMYFMFHDNRRKYGFEGQFGLADADSNWKFDFGSSGPAPIVDDDPRLSSPFQLITSRNKALREFYGAAAAKDNNQDKFTLWSYDRSSQTLRNLGANQCLDAYYESNGRPRVHLFACDGNNDNQKWRVVDNKVLHARFSNLCLDADPNDPNEAVQVYACVGNNDNQVFRISDAVQHVRLQSPAFNRALGVGENDQCHDASAVWVKYQQLEFQV
ncbi:hypothetical protein SDRG_13010 [Saprolegnia diclina VS20]|uniref:glucan endo-1,3-beta-D-glucosidase n=1 Tax=Saprolegnia diclina (strain VS20) TaxID=1156394 RepID=T0Q420_SAPDV|nr:hypothetical protein SDRG_13010 [Saprolegnia diclina VS20]EQC29341.1 hypothetical protein SDRG_13010 [Saprolegnia diclina VS20]|eukprot:XP_008617315.1 hypothetical protein SDRG_13010 [Saprolegnia diclina VS20]